MKKSLNEFQRIDQIARRIGQPGKHVRIGIGDDAALVDRPDANMLLCTDAMAEGIHFDLSYMDPSDLGHKALASCLSDIAAMNGTPLYALFSLAIPKSCRKDFIDAFYEGAVGLARQFSVDIVGGDLSSSRRDVFVDAVAIGAATNPISRAGAKVGDYVAVSGHLGASAAALYGIEAFGKNSVDPFLLNHHARPTPRFDLLPILARFFCTSLIDVSDGLASELRHLGDESGVGFRIDRARIPLHPATVDMAQRLNADPIDWALSGGEDYQLLATLDHRLVEVAGHKVEGFTLIGQVVAPAQGYTLIGPLGEAKSLPISGFDHFASS